MQEKICCGYRCESGFETGGHKGRPLCVVDMEKIIFSGMQMQIPLRHREALKHPDVWK